MAKRIYLKEDGLTGSGPVPAGYKQIGYDGATFSEKSGFTSSTIGGGSGGSGIIEVTYAAAQTLISNSALVVGSNYKITDKADKGIILLAVAPNKFSLEGQGIFLNPDFQSIGDYSGVLAFTGQSYVSGFNVVWQGVAEVGGTDEVVFWNGLHYQIKDSGLFNGTSPDINVAAYTLLPKSVANVGYIEEVDFIHYDFNSDLIIYRADKRGNSETTTSSLQRFQWGNDNVDNNTILNGTLTCINQRGTISENFLHGSNSVELNNSHEGDFIQNSILVNNSIIANKIAGKEISKCLIQTSGFSIILDETINDVNKVLNGVDSTFEATLDMTADFFSNTLTIPTNLNYVGIFTLIDNTAQTISKIVNLPTHKSRFNVVAGNTQLFSHTAVAGAILDQLVSDAAAINTITGRANGSDFIEYERAGNLNRRYNAVISA